MDKAPWIADGLVIRGGKFKGYHRRNDGSMMIAVHGKLDRPCDSCGKTFSVLVGFERHFPQDPDLLLCTRCAEDLVYANT